MSLLVEKIPESELSQLQVDRALFERNDRHYRRTSMVDDTQLALLRNKIAVPRNILCECPITGFMTVDGYVERSCIYDAFAQIAQSIKNVAALTTMAHENNYAVRGFEEFGSSVGNTQRRNLIAVARAAEVVYGWPKENEPEEPFWRAVALAYSLLFDYKLYRSHILANRFHDCFKNLYAKRFLPHLGYITVKVQPGERDGELEVALLFPGEPLVDITVPELAQWLWRAQPPSEFYTEDDERVYRLFCIEYCGTRLARAYDEANIDAEELMQVVARTGVPISAAGHLLNCVRQGILPNSI